MHDVLQGCLKLFHYLGFRILVWVCQCQFWNVLDYLWELCCPNSCLTGQEDMEANLLPPSALPYEVSVVELSTWNDSPPEQSTL